jgi:hypothetical protein
MDLTHALHSGLQPLVDVSRHSHVGGCDLVQMPHSSQHGHLLASTPSSSSSCAAATKDQAAEPTDPHHFKWFWRWRN